MHSVSRRVVVGFLRRVRVRTALMAVVAVPMAGLVLVSTTGAFHRRDVADEAAAMYEAVDELLLLAEARDASVQERMDAESTSLGTAAGISQELITEVLGLDLASRVGPNRARLDEALERVRSTGFLGAPGTERDEAVSPGLVNAIEQLQAVRDKVDDGTITSSETSEFYAALNSGLLHALEVHAARLTVMADRISDESAARLRRLLLAGQDYPALIDALSTETQLAAMIVTNGLVLDSESGSSTSLEDAPSVLLRTVAERDALLSRFEARLDPDLLEVWDGYRDDFETITFEAAVDRLIEPDAVEVSAAGNGPDLATVARSGLHRVVLHTELLPMLGSALQETAADIRDSAEADYDWSVTSTAVLVLLSLGFTSVASVAISSPLRKLEQRARLVRDGEVGEADEESVAHGGLVEVVTVSEVFEEIADNLRVVQGQTTALAEGRLDDPSLSVELPGRLGSAVQASVRRLTDLQERLRSSEALSKAIIDTAAEAIWTLGPDGTIRTANGAAEELVGVSVGDMPGALFAALMPSAEHAEEFQRGLARTDVDSVESHLRHADGRPVPVLLSTSHVDAESGPLVTVFARDITEIKALESLLLDQARTDALTGLPNRRRIVEVLSGGLARLSRRGGGIAVVYADLDGFKRANDRFGHALGDAILREVANRFGAIVRTDETLGRLGGDEFVVVLEGIDDPLPAVHLAERLLDELLEPFDVGGQPVTVGASFGVAWTTNPRADALGLLRDADVAMYRGKSTGGSRVHFFDDGLQEELERRSEIETGLRAALRNGELCLHYQPLVGLGDGAVASVEALIRWKRPGRGLVEPNDFIPVAEESGLIVDIGRYVLEQACRQAQEWQSHPLASQIRIGANIAGVHLTRHDLVGDVEQALALGPGPDRLGLEITETRLVEDLPQAASALRRLRSLGVHSSIDDYGTGYSSITYLQHLPVDTIKIDRTFVSDIAVRDRERAIVASLVGLARAFDLETVAEGVETPSELHTIRELGCDSAQGFLFARPRPAHELVEWLSRPDRHTTLRAATTSP